MVGDKARGRMLVGQACHWGQGRQSGRPCHACQARAGHAIGKNWEGPCFVGREGMAWGSCMNFPRRQVFVLDLDPPPPPLTALPCPSLLLPHLPIRLLPVGGICCCCWKWESMLRERERWWWCSGRKQSAKCPFSRNFPEFHAPEGGKNAREDAFSLRQNRGRVARCKRQGMPSSRQHDR